MQEQSILFPRSSCPHCKTPLQWYELIPIVSWMLLRGNCRTCTQPVSILYPVIELLTVFTLLGIVAHYPAPYCYTLSVVACALIISVRTDIETMMVSLVFTRYLIPVMLFFAAVHWLPITLLDSIFGTIVGYALLGIPSVIYYAITGKQGIGEGDLELLALIGSAVGIEGAIVTLMLASFSGSLLSIAGLASGMVTRDTRIPFAPFLAIGALVYIVWHDTIMSLYHYLYL